mmetsp:Transcript_11300/g.33546  ORF Transcript_11300/g.33546 Transcript_11300/m.33546 type:complete len:223 (+) Transcript_11300:541-1209(+)
MTSSPRLTWMATASLPSTRCARHSPARTALAARSTRTPFASGIESASPARWWVIVEAAASLRPSPSSTLRALPWRVPWTPRLACDGRKQTVPRVQARGRAKMGTRLQVRAPWPCSEAQEDHGLAREQRTVRCPRVMVRNHALLLPSAAGSRATGRPPPVVPLPIVRNVPRAHDPLTVTHCTPSHAAPTRLLVPVALAQAVWGTTTSAAAAKHHRHRSRCELS